MTNARMSETATSFASKDSSSHDKGDARKSGSAVRTTALETLCQATLATLPEDPQREGLRKTPQRFARAFSEMTEGYHQNLNSILNGAVFNDSASEIVLLKNIEFYSLCEHHLLPFFGRVHLAYIPNGRIIGLSKIPRIVEMYARRLQVQERLTQEIADAIFAAIRPHGLACIIEAQHLCMQMRGVQTQNSTLQTQSYLGLYKQEASLRQELRETLRG